MSVAQTTDTFSAWHFKKFWPKI